MVCEESKEKDNIEAPKFICHDNNNVPKIIRNNPKNDTLIVHHQTQKPTIDKDVTTESTASILGSTNGEESKEKDHVEVSKMNNEYHDIDINEKEKRHDVPIIPPQIIDKPTTETAVNLGTGTDIIETNDMSNEVHRRVDVPVELRKKNDTNTFMQKLINEEKNIVQEWLLEVDSLLDSSTINSGAIVSTSNNSTRKETAPTPHGIGKSLPVPPPGCSLVIPPSAQIAGGSFSKVCIEDIKNSLQYKKPLQPQRGLSKCSALLCPNLYLYEHYTRDEKLKTYSNENGPFGLCKIIQIPNSKKM